MKKHIVKASSWTPVELNTNLINSLGTEGLVGIEECTDYTFVTDKFKKGLKRKQQSDHSASSKKSKSVNRGNKDKKKEEVRSVKNTEIVDTFSPSKQGSTIKKSLQEPNVLDTIIESEDLENIQAWENYGLPKSILKGLSDLNFTNPTEIQALTLPAAVLGRRDILGAAETGSGKTLAFGLPILAGILKIREKDANKNEEPNKDSEDSDDSDDSDDEDSLIENGIGLVKSIKLPPKDQQRPLYGLVLTPTRELAIQVKNHLTAVAKYTNIHVAVVVGGMAEVKQQRVLSKGPEIVVATPGRLWELIQQGNNHLSQVDSIRFLAIDETDRMLERGHFQELHALLEKINTVEEKKQLRQNFVFSATLTLVHELPQYLANKKKIKNLKKIQSVTPTQKLQKIVDMLGITNPKIVDVTQGIGTSGTLTECRITCEFDEKDYYVYYFLNQHPGRTLIFCNSIGCVKRLTTLLGLLDCHPLPLHASMQQRQRLKNLDRFKENPQGILIATDVAARGLDIPSVEHVLHYQTPRTSEGYVHRSGRTARVSKEGITVLLIEPTEFPSYLKLCRTLGKSEDLPIFPVQDNYLSAVKQRVNLARELDKLQLQVRKTNSEASWFQKAAEEMDMILDERALKYDTKESSKAKQLADLKRKELSLLLNRPIFPKGLSGKYPLSTGSLDMMLMQEDSTKEKAVDVMKNALEKIKKDKSRKVRLYRPKKNGVQKNDKSDLVIKLDNKHKKSKHKKNKFVRK